MPTVTPAAPSRPAAVSAAAFRAIGTNNEILVTDQRTLAAAVDLAHGYLAELDAAVSRFREDSEVSRLAARAATAEASCFGSAIFLDQLDAGRRAAELTAGLVDFTVGSAVIASGYDADLSIVQARTVFAPGATAPVPGWQRVVRSDAGRVTTPAGTVLDFGATAKARAADVIASRLAAHLPGGFLVNLGGDLATSGTAPDGGWRIGVEGADRQVRQVITITDQAVATSSTQLRTWATTSGRASHIVDPRTGESAEPVWAQVTVVAATALEANAATTAALVLGEAAVDWLAERGLVARLEDVAGRAVCTAGWPRTTTDKEL